MLLILPLILAFSTAVTFWLEPHQKSETNFKEQFFQVVFADNSQGKKVYIGNYEYSMHNKIAGIVTFWHGQKFARKLSGNLYFQTLAAVGTGGNYFLVGKTLTSRDNFDGWIANVDFMGNVQWKVLLDSSSENSLNFLAKARNSLYALGKYFTPDGKMSAQIAKVTLTGKVLKLERITDFKNANPVWIGLKGKYVYAIVNDVINDINQVVLVKLDTNLNVLDKKVVFKSYSALSAMLKGDRIYITGFKYEGKGYKQQLWLSAISTGGRRLWSKVFKSQENAQGQALKFYKGNVLCLYSLSAQELNLSSILMLRPNGEKIWQGDPQVGMPMTLITDKQGFAMVYWQDDRVYTCTYEYDLGQVKWFRQAGAWLQPQTQSLYLGSLLIASVNKHRPGIINLMAFSEQGSLLWTQSYRLDNGSQYRILRIFPQKRRMLIFLSKGSRSSGYTNSVLWLGYDRKVKNIVNIDLSSYIELTDVAMAPDGSFYIVGSKHDGANEQIWLGHIGQAYVPVWQKTLSGYHINRPVRVVLTSRGLALLSIDEGCYSSQNYKTGIWQFDANGNVLWHKQLVPSGFSYPIDMIATKDHGFLVTVYTGSKSLVYKLNSKGGIMWQTVLMGDAGIKAKSLAESRRFYIVTAQSRQNNLSMLIYRLDKNTGRIVSSWEYKSKTGVYPSLLTVSGKDFYVTGVTNLFDKPKVVVLKF